MEKCGKRGKKYFFHIFFISLKINTNYAHMQNFIQIPQKMKTGVQNVFKWEKCTLPFTSNDACSEDSQGILVSKI